MNFILEDQSLRRLRRSCQSAWRLSENGAHGHEARQECNGKLQAYALVLPTKSEVNVAQNNVIHYDYDAPQKRTVTSERKYNSDSRLRGARQKEIESTNLRDILRKIADI